MKDILKILFLLLPVSLCAQKTPEMRVANTIPILESDSHEQIILKAAHVVPTPQQLAALKDAFIGFVHFGPNTFTRMEWGSGMEDPKIFDLHQLDTDQWCRAMKEAGMTKVILTVKHHDGFVLWQSRYTNHGIMSTPYKQGKGDILQELSESCRKYGIKLGIYLSPADLYQIENPEGLYGNLSKYTMRTIPRAVEGRPFENKTSFQFKVDDYNEYFLNQLFELLTEYGPVHEVWFDGAHPKRKGGQTYNYAAWKELIRKLAPEAVIFGKEDIRWGGNESGATRETEWNVIPYEGNPDTMGVFGDITGDSVGMRSQLYGAKYLHYQPAEINTSIREGWFYRDDETQKTRSADDVFDIYERAVGGNAIFLLNIPPNREGRFPDEDVRVLEEVGRRIRETYNKNLFENASGPSQVLDGDIGTYVLLDKADKSLTIKLPQPQTINRLILQEAVPTHSERVEEHAVDAWINGSWQEVVRSTNIGFKRILRFPDVTSNHFRIRVLQSRYTPAIAAVAAYHYQSRPPQLEISRDLEGKISIKPRKDDFGWKAHGVNTAENLNRDLKIRYTIAGKQREYKEPFSLPYGKVEAVAESGGEQGSAATRTFGYLQKNWKVLSQSSSQADARAEKAFDADESTFWQSEESEQPQFLAIDLGQKRRISAFTYTPPQKLKSGMIEQGTIFISPNGKDWKKAAGFEFGNLINDPSTRTYYFKTPVETRYVKIQADRIAGEGKTAAIAEIEFLAPEGAN